MKLLHPVMPHVTEEIWSNLPARGSRLIVAPWPEPAPAYADAESALESQSRRRRRSSAAPGCSSPLEGDEKRIFDAVVRPERVKANGNVEVELERLRKEVARSEGMLANARFVENAPPEVVEAEREKLARYRRELDALGD